MSEDFPQQQAVAEAERPIEQHEDQAHSNGQGEFKAILKDVVEGNDSEDGTLSDGINTSMAHRPGRVDIDKAWDMAHSAKDERADAAQWREGEAADGENHIYGSYGPEEDNKAKIIESWADVLHDHPVSEAYKEAHPDVDFSARGLAKIEVAVNRRFREILGEVEKVSIHDCLGVSKEALESIDGFYNVDLTQPTPHLTLADLMTDKISDQLAESEQAQDEGDNEKADTQYAEAKSLARHYREVLTNPHTTLGELSEIYKELYKSQLYEQQRVNAAIVKRMLEDVKSGRASAQ